MPGGCFVDIVEELEVPGESWSENVLLAVDEVGSDSLR